MKVMIIGKATKASEAGEMPSPEMFAAMGKFNEELIDAILKRGDLVDYHRGHAARAELCRRCGKMSDAKNSYERALSLARQEPERRFLTRRLSEISF